MAIISGNDILGNIIISYPNIIPLINRFNIKLGLKNKSIESICNDYNLDSEFFTTILNTYINNDYFPEKTLKSYQAKTIINYILQAYNSYSHFSIPNIERHFNLLISHSGNNNNLHLILNLFNELKTEIKQLIDFDSNTWFPSIITQNVAPLSIGSKSLIENSINIEEKINDLKNMFVIHLTGDYEPNLCYAVISAIISFENDIIQNNRIRNNILVRFTTA